MASSSLGPPKKKFTLRSLDESSSIVARAFRSPYRERYRDAFMANIASPIDQTIIAYSIGEDATVCGGVICTLIESQNDPRSIYILSLFVFSRFQRRGIGAELLDHVISVTTEQSIDFVYAHVRTADSVAMQFFQSHGFLNVNAIPDAYADILLPDCSLLGRSTVLGTVIAGLPIGETKACGKEERANSFEKAPEQTKGIEEEEEDFMNAGVPSTKGDGMVIIQVEHPVVNMSGYHSGRQLFIHQATSSPVFIRSFDRNMESYFSTREILVHTNIQRMYALTSICSTKFRISCECLSGTLESLLQSLASSEGDSSRESLLRVLPGKKWDEFILDTVKQIRAGLKYLYGMGICHGRLSIKDVGYTLDHNFHVSEIGHIVFKLTLPEHECWPQKRVGSKDGDRKNLGQIVKDLVGASPNPNPELDFMADYLLNSPNCTLDDMDRIPTMWTLATRMDSINIMAYERLATPFSWTEKFEEHIALAKAEFEYLGVKNVSEYENTLGDFVLFQRHVSAHYHQFRPHAKSFFGSDKGVCMRKFQEAHPTLFIVIYNTMSKEQHAHLMAMTTVF